MLGDRGRVLDMHSYTPVKTLDIIQYHGVTVLASPALDDCKAQDGLTVYIKCLCTYVLPIPYDIKEDQTAVEKQKVYNIYVNKYVHNLNNVIIYLMTMNLYIIPMHACKVLSNYIYIG